MREILFRGKRIDTGEWEEGFLFVYRSQYGIAKVVYDETTICSDPDTYMCDISDLYYPKVLPETVGQFTGMYDKNGIKIFEGDIVKLLTMSRPHEVKYGDGRFYMEGTAIPIGHINHFVVIGNIHDNPEIKLCRWDEV